MTKYQHLTERAEQCDAIKSESRDPREILLAIQMRDRLITVRDSMPLEQCQEEYQ